MSTGLLLGVGAFWLAYYYFVLRKYNTLGFRMFSLFFVTGLSVCYWWYVGYRELKAVQQKGIATQAIVISKAVQKVNNILQVRFTDPSGKAIIRTQEGGISDAEFAAVHEGGTVLILYSPTSDTFFLADSYYRQLGDNVYFLIFPGLLFLISILCWIFLRRYRVQAREGSIYEYLVDENGKVIFDDAATSTSRAFRNVSTFGKLAELFRK